MKQAKKRGPKPKPKPRLKAEAMPKTGNKRDASSSVNLTIPQREEVKLHVARLYLQGYSMVAMSKWISENTDLKISSVTTSRYTKQVLQEWHEARINDIDVRITAELIRLDRVEQTAWDGWERSKQDKVKTVSKVKDDGYENSTEVTENVGDVKFLELARQCILDRMQWLSKGTFAPDEANIFNIQNNTVFIGVVDRKRPEEASNAIEAQIISADGPK